MKQQIIGCVFILKQCLIQVLGNVPTISIDKTDGCQMYLSDKSLDVEIISSKSSEMNVLIPKGNGDYVSSTNGMNRKFLCKKIVFFFVADRKTNSRTI